MLELEEASMNFDLENVEAFLNRISKIIPSGYGLEEVTETFNMVKSTPHDEEREVTYIINFEGDSAKLIIRCFMDDIDAPDLCFLTMHELAEEINHQMEQFCEELGI